MPTALCPVLPGVAAAICPVWYEFGSQTVSFAKLEQNYIVYVRAVPGVFVSLHYVTEKMTCKLSISAK